ncbi:MAG: DUF721 domain-containing protein [Proteobacteria bacterium]|nr:DUF721 domain-containing protein [Pseudomonadota bacterium]
MRKLSLFVDRLVTPLCHKQGFVHAQIILNWSSIVGEHFARLCSPLKLTFPYKDRSQGCLYLTAPSVLSLELHFQQDQILEKINQYFGYKAIHKITIRHSSSKPLQKKTSTKDDKTLPLHIQEQLKAYPLKPHLKEALEKLAKAL